MQLLPLDTGADVSMSRVDMCTPIQHTHYPSVFFAIFNSVNAVSILLFQR